MIYNLYKYGLGKRGLKIIQDWVFNHHKKLNSIEDKLNRLESILLNSLDPLEKHATLTRLRYPKDYEEWTVNRINKILEIYDNDWFEGKRILELGGGHGEVGAFLAALGAEVVSLEARSENVTMNKIKYKNLNNLTVIKHDLDDGFAEFGFFDLIINFGVIYHLRDIEKNLKECVRVGNEILLDSLVTYSGTDEFENFIEDSAQIDTSVHGKGTKPSQQYIESFFTGQASCNIERLFDRKLNILPYHIYDWEYGKPDQFSRFMLTNHSIEQLRKKGLPVECINNLSELNGQTHLSYNGFMLRVEIVIGNKNARLYEQDILEQAVSNTAISRFWRFYKTNNN